MYRIFFVPTNCWRLVLLVLHAAVFNDTACCILTLCELFYLFFYLEKRKKSDLEENQATDG